MSTPTDASLFTCQSHRSAKQASMTGVDSIEVADRDCAGPRIRPYFTQTAIDPKHSAHISSDDAQTVIGQPHASRELAAPFPGAAGRG